MTIDPGHIEDDDTLKSGEIHEAAETEPRLTPQSGRDPNIDQAAQILANNLSAAEIDKAIKAIEKNKRQEKAAKAFFNAAEGGWARYVTKSNVLIGFLALSNVMTLTFRGCSGEKRIDPKDARIVTLQSQLQNLQSDNTAKSQKIEELQRRDPFTLGSSIIVFWDEINNRDVATFPTTFLFRKQGIVSVEKGPMSFQETLLEIGEHSKRPSLGPHSVFYSNKELDTGQIVEIDARFLHSDTSVNALQEAIENIIKPDCALCMERDGSVTGKYMIDPDTSGNVIVTKYAGSHKVVVNMQTIAREREEFNNRMTQLSPQR